MQKLIYKLTLMTYAKNLSCHKAQHCKIILKEIHNFLIIMQNIILLIWESDLSLNLKDF